MLAAQDRNFIQSFLTDWQSDYEFNAYLLSSFAALFNSDSSMPIQNLRFMAWNQIDDTLCEIFVCSQVYSMTFNDFRHAYKPGVHDDASLAFLCPLWNLSNAPECVQNLLRIYERVKTNKWAHDVQLDEPESTRPKGSLIVE